LGLKKPWAREEENKNALLVCVWVHPQNGLNGLTPNWCTGGCWFTLAEREGDFMDNFDVPFFFNFLWFPNFADVFQFLVFLLNLY
jgi:hypothetical protein